VYEDSTLYYDKERPSLGIGYNKDNITQIEKHTKFEIIENYLKSRPILHQSEYYLIEGKYYTDTFFEISKIYDNSPLCELILDIFYERFLGDKPWGVFVLSQSIHSFIKTIQHKFPDIKYYYYEGKSLEPMFIRASISANKDQPLILFTDVVCTGNDIRRLVQISTVPLKIYCFVNAQKSGFNYVTSEKREGSLDVDIVSLAKQKIAPIKKRPPRDKNILIIDKITHTPALFDTITQSEEFDAERITEIAVKAGALYHMHLDVDSRHYAIFFDFQKLLPALGDGLITWFDNSFNTIEKKGIAIQDVTVCFVEEEADRFETVYGYFNKKSLNRLKYFTKDLLRINPKTSEKSKCVWIILSAVSSGETLQQFLEAASHYDDLQLIHVSIVLARLESQKLAFFLNITSYKDIPVQIEVLSFFPKPCFSTEEGCSLCEAEALINKQKNLLKDYPHLFDLLTEKGDFYRLRSNFENVGNIDTKKGYESILLRPYYNNAIRYLDDRKKITKQIDKKSHTFFEMIGYDFASNKFSENILSTITYTRYSEGKIEAKAKKLLDQGIKLTLPCLLGIRRLFPEIFDAYLPNVIDMAKRNNDSELFLNLVFVFLIFVPDDLGELRLLEWQSMLSLEVHPVSKELSRFLSDKQNVTSKKTLNAFLEMRRMLLRSSGWGLGIDTFRMDLFTDDNSVDVHQIAFQNFKNQGLSPLKHNYALLTKDHDEIAERTIWHTFSKLSKQKIVESFESICSLAMNIDHALNKGDYDCNLIQKNIDEIDQTGGMILEVLNGKFTNPLIVRTHLLPRIKRKFTVLNTLTIDARFAQSQPSILCSINELEVILTFYFENVIKEHEHVLQNHSVVLDFQGYMEQNRTSLVIADNFEWKRNPTPFGGLVEIINICNIIGAETIFNNISDVEKSNVHCQKTGNIEIRFLAFKEED
jgi:hypothetical protein